MSLYSVALESNGVIIQAKICAKSGNTENLRDNQGLLKLCRSMNFVTDRGKSLPGKTN